MVIRYIFSVTNGFRPPPLHHFQISPPVWSDFQNSDAMCREIVALPIFGALSERKITARAEDYPGIIFFAVCSDQCSWEDEIRTAGHIAKALKRTTLHCTGIVSWVPQIPVVRMVPGSENPALWSFCEWILESLSPEWVFLAPRRRVWHYRIVIPLQ